jgi:Domain of unknown function (DUF4412)
MRLTGILCVALCGLAAPAAADVTVTQTVAGKAAVINLNGESVTRIKGNKMRTEQTRGDKTDVVIIDIDGQRMISLDAGKKEATVIPLSQLQETLSKVTSSEVKVKITPTGETKQVAGYSCKVHDMAIAMPFSPGGGDMKMAMAFTGPSCLSKDAPGTADYARLYTAAAEKGFIFGDPRQAKGPMAAQAKGMATLYKAMAEQGMPLEQQLSVGFEGEGPMAGLMNKMGKTTMNTTVTKIDTAPIADDLFEVPAGYKVKTQ